MDKHLIITVISALLASGSFVAFALPFLNRTEKKERYRSVIEKRRKDLYKATKESSAKKGKDEVSAADSIASFTKCSSWPVKWAKKSVTRCCRPVFVTRKRLLNL